MILTYILLFVVVFLIGFKCGSEARELKLKSKILNSENIVKCFEDVDWSVQTFSSGTGETLLETKDGVKHFYKVHSIDDAIKRLNKLINETH